MVAVAEDDDKDDAYTNISYLIKWQGYSHLHSKSHECCRLRRVNASDLTEF